MFTRNLFHTFGLARSAAPRTLRVEPARGWQWIDLRELWQYRELLYLLAWRDVKVRYKQTLLGTLWAILQPLLMMTVFTIFFGMARLPSGSTPYPLFVLAGLLPWIFFSTAVSNAGNSVLNSEKLITKVYFPRLTIPIASVTAALVDLLVAQTVLVGVMLWYGVTPGPRLVLLPLILLLLSVTALGIGTLLAALNVAYRDFRHVLPFLIQLWLFATPTVFMELPTVSATTQPSLPVQMSSSSVEEPAQPWSQAAHWLTYFNPMTELIASYRACVLGHPLRWLPLLRCALLAGIVVTAAGLYFRRVEASFADII